MLTQEEIDDWLLPDWAERKAEGDYTTLRCALQTRDGRRTGNAVNAGICKNATEDHPTVYLVVTDAGNVIRPSESEMKSMFYPPQWIMKEFLPAHVIAIEES